MASDNDSKIYFDYSSLDYTIDFFKMKKSQALKYIPSGVLHGPFDDITQAKREAMKITTYYITELREVRLSIKGAQVKEIA